MEEALNLSSDRLQDDGGDEYIFIYIIYLYTRNIFTYNIYLYICMYYIYVYTICGDELYSGVSCSASSDTALMERKNFMLCTDVFENC